MIDVAYTTELDVFLNKTMSAALEIDGVVEVKADAIPSKMMDCLNRVAGNGWHLDADFVTLETSDSLYHLKPRFYTSPSADVRMIAPEVRWEMSPVIEESQRRCQWIEGGEAFGRKRGQYIDSLNATPWLELDALETDALMDEYVLFTRRVMGKGGKVRELWWTWEGALRVLDQKNGVRAVWTYMDTTDKLAEIPMT